MKNIVREIFDALLLIAVLIAIVFLVYYLQLPPEDRPPLSDLIPRSTGLPTASTQTLGSTPFATQTKISAVIPTSTATSRPTATATPPLTSTATPLPTSTTQPSADAEITDGIEQGNQIVEAIEAYIRARSFYPATLEDLVPAYLPRLPVTKAGQAFFYRVFERTTVMAPEIYWVSFRVVSQNNVTCTYYRRLEHWDCNYSSP